MDNNDKILRKMRKKVYTYKGIPFKKLTVEQKDKALVAFVDAMHDQQEAIRRIRKQEQDWISEYFKLLEKYSPK